MARLTLFACVFSVTALPLAAEPALRLGPGVEALTRGLICAPPEGGRRDAPDTASGWIHVPEVPIEILVEGTTAPARLGTGFGVRFVLAGAAPLPVRYVVTHPPMPPEGITIQSWESFALPGAPEQVFFQFDTSEELLPGPWSFTALSGETELFHAAFDIVAPEAVPHLDGMCAGGDLLALSRKSPAEPG
ncbi:MAG: DUF3859 domain-containing protein [Pararhodobacter sp.]|nr:DUF3859 domain-containing protein [Pararhodobacter sp.]